MTTVEFSTSAGILSEAVSQHHLLEKNDMAIKYPNGPEMSAIIHYHGTS